MIQLSKKMRIFATSFAHHGQLSGELQCFDPSDNLENYCMRAIRLMAVPPVGFLKSCIRMMAACLSIYRCEPFFSFLRIQVFQNLQTKSVRRLTLLLCLSKMEFLLFDRYTLI